MNKKVIVSGIVLAAAAIAAVGFFGFKSRQQSGAGNAQSGLQMQQGANPGGQGEGSRQGGQNGSGNRGGQGSQGGFGGQGGQGGGSQQGSQSASYAMVRASRPTTGDVSVTSSLTGTVAAADVIYVSSKAAGDITAVYVKAGDYVEAGTLLCEIDTGQVESAQNSLASAEVSLNNANSNLSRMQILYNGGDITDQEFEQANNSVKTAQIQYNNAKLNYDRQVEYSSVTAPISGRIESCAVSVYDHVNNNAELCVITGDGENRIDFYVSERMMKELKEGDSVEVIKNGNTYNGTVTEISSIVDASTGMFKCKAQLEKTGEIAIGSSVKIRLVTDRSTGVMLVPVDAIYYSGSKAYVYLVEDGKAVMRRVEVGLYDNEVAEIKDGLSYDDLVVGTWSSNLYEGANVRVMNEEGDAEGAAEEVGGASEKAGNQTGNLNGDHEDGGKKGRNMNGAGEEQSAEEMSDEAAEEGGAGENAAPAEGGEQEGPAEGGEQ